MASDYQEITKYNEKQLGLDTASRRTQICMYSDSTHFIYEILQNADDYEATEVIFKLSKDQLLIEHNGTPFNEENVRAITYFGKSTSRESLVKTGRFGVGFKSVFAITSTPTIVSGNEHFQIYDLYRIREHEYPVGFSRQRTRITLPFNHETQKPDYVEKFMSREDAYLKLSSRITELNMNALLFTQNVREIRWEIDDGSGHYLRKDTIDGEARITTIINEEQEQHYLVFSRVPEWRGRKYKAVEIAFAMDKDKRITSTEDYLYVLFPTKEETHLKFLLNGPYRTNPARETISEDDSFNKHLIKETSALMKDVIFHIKEMTLLTIQFLGILPNNGDGLKNFYSPILNEIARTFHQQKLIQTDDGCYASASDVLLGPAAIREVITRNELQFFTERENACWAKGVQQNSRADQFLRSLDIETWSWKQLEKVLEYKYWISDDRNRWGNLWNGTEEDNEWIAGRNARWLQNFYILLADGVRTSDLYAYTITRCQIIRTLERGKIKHVVAKDAYFPKKGYSDLPRIKPEILQGKTQQRTEKVEESLIVLGVSKIGSRERIDYLINTYYDDEEMLLLVNKKQHLQHMKSFIKRWKENQNTDIFNEATIFLTREINDIGFLESAILIPLSKNLD